MSQKLLPCRPLISDAIVKRHAKTRDQREQTITARAVARTGWRPCRPLIAGALVLAALASCHVAAGTVDSSQSDWHEKYKRQQNAPQPEDMLLNTDAEPDLTDGFKPLFNGKDLTGWAPKGGTCTFEAKQGAIVGTCVPGSPSTYLCTEAADFQNFIFTCDVKWKVDGNSGVMFRAHAVPAKGDSETVVGPQAELEGTSKDRGWSGGIYGQSCGGFYYPLWLVEHKKARAALKPQGWNRLTISAQGNVVKTWINGVPAAHWVDDGTHPKGFFGLQIHKGNQGTVLWKNIRIKQLPQ